ncbi:hypothetical protein FXO38_36129 [Capsicum annuum]|uniref:Uncharacterized protein n=1 Tax=Capsicum annuum TaxID=4072 RepID=A0A2G2YG71_CAPAN|nr:hypothetical protein FXO38_36129 [Capsicum annuum]KAF3618990.1 hypothetical protein FXO37_33932 [Capsicum annuum]PHT68746.1 hypothetical protein T459_28233 [Capsicum annuum]
MSQRTQIVNQNPFEVHYVENIMHKKCESLNYVVFIAGYVEYLSEGIEVPSYDFDAESHRMRFLNYDLRKAQNHYASDNDDSPKSRSIYVPRLMNQEYLA